MFKFLIRLGLFGVLLAGFLEVVFRTVVPAAEMPAGYQDPEYLIMALDASQKQEGHNSMGRLGRPRFAWHINNFGFNSNWDYRTPEERDIPCIVVIGNSYTQGLYSDVDEHLAARIQDALDGSAEVYNLASSGLPVSQAPRVVEYARDHFDPDLIIIQAGSGSVHGSLRNNGPVSYCQQYRWADKRLQIVPPSTFTVNQRNRKIRVSALVRYLYYNSNLNLGGQGMVQQAIQVEEPSPSAATAHAEPVLELVVDRVMAEIEALVPGTPVLFVFDADRNALYASGSKPERLRNSTLLEAGAERRRYYFLDLTDAFWEEYSTHGRIFNFSDNYHWNPYGVEIVAQAIVSELQDHGLVLGNRFIGASPPETPVR